MKIKMITLSCGANGVLRPGDITDVSEREGDLLVGGGYAELVENPATDKNPIEDNTSAEDTPIGDSAPAKLSTTNKKKKK